MVDFFFYRFAADQILETNLNQEFQKRFAYEESTEKRSYDADGQGDPETFYGPVPNQIKIEAVIKVVRLASIIVENALA